MAKVATLLRPSSRALALEGIVLLIATPFLLFPSRLPSATGIVLVAIAGSWLLGRRYFPVTPFNVALLLWEGALLVGILVTADPDLTLQKAAGLILGLAAWRTITLYAAIDERNASRAGFLYLFLALGFVLLGVLAAEWRTKVPGLQSVIDMLPTALLQLPGASDEGVQLNQLAGTILLALPLSLSLALSRGWSGEGRVRRLSLLFISALLGGLLLLSQSRGGWLGALLGIGGMGLLWWLVLPAGRSRRRLGLLLLTTAALGLLALAAVGPAGLRRIWEEPPRETAVGSLNSIRFRQEVWRWSLEAVQDFPFTGPGLGTFRRVAPRLYPLEIPYDYDIAHAHNIYLQVALDVGLPGLVAYGAIVGLALIVGVRTARRAPHFRGWALGLLGCLLALHAYGLADALAPGSKPGLLFWFALGMLSAMESQSRTRDHAANRLPPGP